MASAETAEEVLELFGADFVRDPHPVLARLRAEAPVRLVATPNGLKTWLVTRYDDARALLTDPRLSKDMRVGYGLIPHNFADPAKQAAFGKERGTRKQFARELSTTMLDSDPPDHTRLRRLVGKAFTVRQVELLRPRIAELTGELLDALEGRDEADLMDALTFPVPFTVICWMLGVPPEDRTAFRRWSNLLTSGSGTDEVLDASQEMVEYLRTLIASKRRSPADDLLTALIQVRDGGDKLDETELMSMAFLLLVAGHETTVNMLNTGTLALLTNPDQRARLLADDGLWDQAIDEFLRIDAPLANATWRFTLEPIRLGDVLIPEGEFVTISLSAAGRDPERYPDPDRVDITRRTSAHLAFGHGVHHCLGAPLARLEGRIVLGELFRRFPRLRLATEFRDLTWRQSFNLRGLAALPVALS
ncbi:Cytochrome P450 [Lentzea albidocapillata subsp. violacea]|uniref:Cytochrome P450 n=1 Tax=Lentzea albidocapillata subsp. violacea TaxID=128104 RepID=A0A1G9LRL4_9PSEU|nr:cytochrome P450 [Lentzea albidocapillata]SDL64593.1 Cytochrome P450 [Lentzea albidocapillata subsp. violacea]